MSSGRTCAVALAYARGEVEFIGEWLDYHLTLGISHVFLGIHVNEDLAPVERHLTSRRPYPAMYQAGRTEADVVEEFLGTVAGFGSRVTAYLLHRDFFPVPEGHTVTQLRLYNEVLAEQRHDFEWIAPFDIDEYLVPQPPFGSITAALDAVPEHLEAVMMEQVIAEERWDAERRPRSGPLITPEVRRCSQVVGARHGIKTFVRCRAAASLGIHGHELVAGGMNLADRRLLVYHFHGFPGTADVQQYRVPVEREELDWADSRPWEVLEHARQAANRPSGP